MKYLKIMSIIFLILIISNCANNDNSNNTIKVMTFNIRVDVPSDGLNAWHYRKANVATIIRFHHVDIVGLQEALFEQVKDLEGYLSEYDWFGVGRDDGDKEGEFMAIFYLKNRFNIINNSTFWLSKNPEIPGKGWDAACNRIVTWGKFEDNNTTKIFYLFNTHFDHIGEIAREESAKLLLKNINNIAGNSDVIVIGDFNSTPNSITYKILTQGFDRELDFRLIDTKMVSHHPHQGPYSTFTGFKLSNLTDNDKLIDYIFIKNKMKVLNHVTLSDTFDGFFPSDHMPVLAEIILE
ncbi:MAG: endonuclease/exonuclease/phosphatase family protein [Ignavibacteriaceae bacterium]